MDRVVVAMGEELDALSRLPLKAIARWALVIFLSLLARADSSASEPS